MKKTIAILLVLAVVMTGVFAANNTVNISASIEDAGILISDNAEDMVVELTSGDAGKASSVAQTKNVDLTFKGNFVNQKTGSITVAVTTLTNGVDIVPTVATVNIVSTGGVVSSDNGNFTIVPGYYADGTALATVSIVVTPEAKYYSAGSYSGLVTFTYTAS